MTPAIEWRDIPGFETLYQVSNDGQVRSFYSAKVGRVLRPLTVPNGYLQVSLYKNGKRVSQAMIQHLVLLAFVGQRPVACVVNHINGDRSDNRLENLEYVTQSENVKHAYEKLGRAKLRGEKHAQAKLTDSDVVEIKRLLNETPLYLREIAERFGVSYKTISSIKSGESWTHIS